MICDQLMSLMFCWQFDEDVDFNELGEITEGFSGSDLKEICEFPRL